jgi:hypothetical protein
VPAAEEPRFPGLAVHQGVALALAVALLITAGGIARQAAVGQERPGFTQLWMLPAFDGSLNSVRLGLHSYELAPVRYRLVVDADGHTLIDHAPLELAPGDLWQVVVPLTPDYPQPAFVSARLYRLDDPAEIYRRVELQGSDGR